MAASRQRAGRLTREPDLVALEEPLELQVNGTAIAVLMRTPGHDAELGLGFCLSERLIASPRDLRAVHHDSHAARPAADGNVLRLLLDAGVRVDLEALRRNTFASSSCGVCGKASIEQVLSPAAPRATPTRVAATPTRTRDHEPILARLGRDALLSLPAKLRAHQPAFDATGGTHAVGLFDSNGTLIVAREDVGRHNALDKVLGHAAQHVGWPLAGHVLLVSGRISFELVQKAAAAEIALVAGVSAPTSLAVELASAAHMTLVGFLRGDGFNVYTEPSGLVA